MDFTQKPGEGEMLMVTFEAMRRVRTVHRGPLPFSHRRHGRGNAKKTVRVFFSFQA